MIRQCFVIAVILAAGTVCCNLFAEDTSREKPDVTNTAEDALTIRIKTTAKSYKAGEPVRIVCTLANNSSNYSATLIIGGRMGDFSKADWIPSRIFRSFLRNVET